MTAIKTFQSDIFDLQYCVEGTGPTALVVGSALYYARTFSATLRDHLRLVFMDHRGFAPAYLWEPLRDSFHDLTMRVFEKSGHAPHYEEAALFDRELLGWLNSH